LAIPLADRGTVKGAETLEDRVVATGRALAGIAPDLPFDPTVVQADPVCTVTA
jgi:hypothetical protein